MSDIVGEAWVVVRPETSGFGPALTRDVAGPSAAAGARAGKEAGTSFSRSFAETVKTGAAVVGIVGAFETVKEAIHEGAAQSGEFALLNQALKNAGQSATLYGQNILNLIQHQAVERGFIDDELYPAYTRLLRATNDNAKSYRLLGDAEDIARQRHVQVGIAALALAKFEQGSVTALQRLGIILPQHIRDLKGAQKETEGLAYIERQFAGSAEAFAQTGEGALQQFASARRQVSEAIGTALLPEFEAIGAASVKFANNEANLNRIQRDVADAAHLVEGGIKATVVAFETAEKVVSPVVNALGGYDKAAEVAFGLVALRKLQQITIGFAGWAKTVVAGESAAAAATSTDTVAVAANTGVVAANTAALGAQAVALDAATAGLGLNAAAATRGGVVLEATAATAAAGRAKFLSLGLSGEGLAGVLKSGIAPAAVLAGYELSKLVEKIPHWNSAFESLGGHLADVAAKIGLISQGASKVPQFAAGQQQQLANAYQLITRGGPGLQQAERQAFGNLAQTRGNRYIDPQGNLTAAGRDRIIQQLVGPGYTFNDAQVLGQAARRRQADQAGVGARPIGSRNAAAGFGPAPVPLPTDTDYQIALQNALATKTTSDEEALYRDRLGYINRRIATLKKNADLTAAEKKQLLSLETQRNQLESDITGIQDKAAQAAQQAAQKAREARQKAQQAYADALSLRADDLQLQADEAQLTVNNQQDDLKAARAQVAFDRAAATNAKLTAQERAQYAHAAVAAEQQIVSINQQIHDREAQAYRNQLSITEQRLQLAATRAQLTDKSIKDDRKADEALLAFYRRESHDMKLTEAERLQYASQAVQEQLTIKGLTKGAGAGASLQDIFGEAASEFSSYGSNIAGRNGVLSGQDARAEFSRLLLQGHAIGRAADDARHQEQLAEQRRQTGFLARIADAVDPRTVKHVAGSVGTAKNPKHKLIDELNKTASMVGVN